jgi:hypothetical protein
MAPKSKANGAGAKAKPEKATPSASGTSTPVPDGVPTSGGSFSKPDKAAYDAEQDQLRKKIDEIQTKLVRPLIRPMLVAHANHLLPRRLPSRRKSPTGDVMMLPPHAKKSSRASSTNSADSKQTTRTPVGGSSTS